VSPQQGRLIRADTAALRDSVRGKGDLVQWVEPDSVLRHLLARSGRTIIRFQADSTEMGNVAGEIRLYGQPAAVMWGSTLIVADTIIFNDSLQYAQAIGRNIVLRDPTQNDADVEARGLLTYNIRTGAARLTEVSTAAVEEGQVWVLHAEDAAFRKDDESGRYRMYGHVGDITSCTDPHPHYHIRASSFKMVFGRLLVARPAVFYVKDVPVFIMPFVINDMRQGRRSGILSPRFGLSDVVRNSSAYRREIMNVGLYWAANEYMDAKVWLDWRSGASPRQGDPGYIRYSAEVQYKVLERFLSGRAAVVYSRQGDGRTNTALSLSHSQEFSSRRRLSVELNYVTSTAVQQRQEVLAFRELQTIRSSFNYSQSLGSLSISTGGSRTQYPGQRVVDQTLPTLSISSRPISLAPNVLLTPSLSLTNTQRFNVERLGPLSYTYVPGPGSAVDSAQVIGDSRNSRMSLELPLTVGSLRWSNSFQFTDAEDDFPQAFLVRDVNDTSISQTRVFPRTFRTDANWSTSISIPATFFPRTLRMTPSIGLSNVHPGALWVRSERSAGEFVSQSKRPQYTLALSPTLYGLFGGLGPFARIRHALSLQLSYSYAPRADVSDAYLEAIGTTRTGYLGSLAQSTLSLSMNHVFEAKLRGDPAVGDTGKKVRLLVFNTTPLSWDFERAKATGGTGLSSDRFGMNVRSDLLPGFDFSADYSLFEGNILSDSATFKPYLTGIRASFSLSKTQNPIAGLLALFRPQRARTAAGDTAGVGEQSAASSADEQYRATLGAGASAVGSSARDAAYVIGTPPTAWSARLDFSLSRQRPPRGEFLVVENDAAQRCQALNISPFAFDQCVREFEALALADPNADLRPPGGIFVRQPPRTSVSGTLIAPLTPKWSMSWTTSYDFEVGDFSSQMINLQRDMHDATATFSFSRSTSGSFLFSFSIFLKAQPDLKFDYTDANYAR
jgi:hypothetical protein